jgi:hemoglobin/transferrin/lactoferrin receptor protein
VHFSVPGFPLGPGTVFTGIDVFISTPGLEPERANQIEIGGRYARHDLVRDGDRLSFAANAYYAKVDDFVDTIVQFIDFSTGSFNPVTGNFEVNGSTRSVNVDAVLWGVEAEVDYDTGDWFAGAGLTIPRGRNVDGGALGSIPQDRLVLTAGFRPLPDVEIGGRATLLDGQDDAPPEGVNTPGARCSTSSRSMPPTRARWRARPSPRGSTISPIEPIASTRTG